MTPRAFFLRYTAVPFVAIVLVAGWAFFHQSTEIGAREYASLVEGYPKFSPRLKREVAAALEDGQIQKSRYSSLVRDTLREGYLLDWPALGDDQTARERARLNALVRADAP